MTRTNGESATATCIVETPLGPMKASAEGDFLTGLSYVAPGSTGTAKETVLCNVNHPVLVWVRIYLRCYFAVKVGNHDFPLAPQGSEFQQRVWKVLSRIPYGRTVLPQTVARLVGVSCCAGNLTPSDVQTAIKENPIQILIPSHRVLDATRRVSGRVVGDEKQEALLLLEGVLLDTFSFGSILPPFEGFLPPQAE